MRPAVETTGTRAARLLMQDRETLANAVTEALYRESPRLLEQHGERGRAHCLQDMHYSIDHLIPAVDLGDASLFTHYAEWLDDLLRARNVPTRDVIRCLELLRDESRRRHPAAEAGAIGDIIEAGLRSLSPS